PRHGALGGRAPAARQCLDLALALDVIAGPDEADEGIGYGLALPRPRHDDLKSFRAFIIDSHPLMPTGHVVRSAIGRLAERLERLGVKGAHTSPSLPDLAAS